MREGPVRLPLPQASALETRGDVLIVKRRPQDETPCTGLWVVTTLILPGGRPGRTVLLGCSLLYIFILCEILLYDWQFRDSRKHSPCPQGAHIHWKRQT